MTHRVRHLLLIPDGNRRHARREYLRALLHQSLDRFEAALATFPQCDREATRRRIRAYARSGRDPGWCGARDPLDASWLEAPEPYLLASYRASAEILDRVLLSSLHDKNIRELTLYAAQEKNLSRSDINVRAFLCVGAEIAFRWSSNAALCGQAQFRLVGDRALIEAKRTQPRLKEVTEAFLDHTGRLEAAGHGAALRVNILAAYHFEWEVNQAIERGRFSSANMVVAEPVDVVFRTGSRGQAKLSGALPCQAAFAQLVFRDAYFPDCDSRQIVSDVSDLQCSRNRSGL